MLFFVNCNKFYKINISIECIKAPMVKGGKYKKVNSTKVKDKKYILTRFKDNITLNLIKDIILIDYASRHK